MRAPHLSLPHLSYANVMSTLGVFIALGGTSYAVAKLPKNAVGERELKDSAVTGAKVKDGSLTAADLLAGTLLAGPAGGRGARGADGPEGAKGEPGATGATGARGPSDLFVATGGGPLPAQANVRGTVARLNNLPAGNYLFMGSAHVNNWEQGGAIAVCAIKVNGDEIGNALNVVGSGSGSTRVADFTPMGWATVAASSSATFECGYDNAVNGSANNVRLVALRVETLRK